jgi:hypothetical protein
MPRPKRMSPELLGAALEGLQQRLAEVDQNIAEVKRLLRSGPASPAAEPAHAGRRRRKMTAAAKRRIAEAQRKRWAAFRAQAAGKRPAKRRGRPPASARKASAPESE